MVIIEELSEAIALKDGVIYTYSYDRELDTVNINSESKLLSIDKKYSKIIENKLNIDSITNFDITIL